MMANSENSLGHMPGKEHDCWLAMRSAYAEYRQAAEAVQHDPLCGNDAEPRERVAALERRQLETFEQYLEARMEFLESRVDEGHRYCGAAPGSAAVETGFEGFAVQLLRYKWVVEVLAIMLLCATTFSSVRESQRVRELEADRDNVRALLTETQQGVRRLDKKVTELRTPRISSTRLIHQTSPGRAAVRKPSEHGHWRRLSASQQEHQRTRNATPPGKSQNPVPGRRILNDSMSRSRESDPLVPVESSLGTIAEPDDPTRPSVISGLAKWLASTY